MPDIQRRSLKIWHATALQVLGLCMGIGAYSWVSHIAPNADFIPVFSILAIVALSIIVIQWYLRKGKLWMEMPTYMTIYVLFALFIPTLWLYNSDVLKAILDWDDALILQACGLGVLFLPSLWMSYDIGKVAFTKIVSRDVQHRIPLRGIHFMMGISLGASLIAIFTGTFGVLQSRDFASTANYSQYIDLLQQLGILGIILLVYQYPARKGLIGGYTLILFLIGILAAHKQAALMPFVAVGITYYFRTHKIPLRWLLLGALAMFLAFAIVAMIRQFYFDRYRDGVSSVAEVAHISRNALNMDEFDKAYQVYDVGDQIIMRVFYGNAIAKAIEYCTKNGFGVPSENRFVHVFAAPVYAFVPRVIFPGKPKSGFGNWFAREVFVRAPVDYSVGITPVGYGYMLGGHWGVILVSLTLGVFMALLHNLLFQKYFVIYVFCIIRMLLPPDVTWEYIAGSLKLIVMAWVLLILVQLKWKLPFMSSVARTV